MQQHRSLRSDWAAAYSVKGGSNRLGHKAVIEVGGSFENNSPPPRVEQPWIPNPRPESTTLKPLDP